MILPLLVASALVAPPVVEVIAPREQGIVVQAVVRVPALGEREWAAARAYTELVLEGSPRFSRQQVLADASAGGWPASAKLMPDHIRIQLAFPKQSMPSVARAVGALLREPALLQSKLDALPWMPRAGRPWDRALFPWVAPSVKPDRQEVLDFVKAHVRPENVFLAVGGPFQPGEAVTAFADLWSGFNASVPSRFSTERPLRPLSSTGSKVGSVELWSPPFSAKSGDFPSRMLALFALGVGKGSDMYQALREELGLSYVQQAILWPAPEGFQGRLLMLRTPAADAKEDDPWDSSRAPESLRSVLEARVSKWGEVDRQRALGAAEAAFRGNGPWHLFAFEPQGLLDSGFADQVFLAAYWSMKTGAPFDGDRLLRTMAQVSLDDLRESASRLLSDALGRVVRAEP